MKITKQIKIVIFNAYCFWMPRSLKTLITKDIMPISENKRIRGDARIKILANQSGSVIVSTLNKAKNRSMVITAHAIVILGKSCCFIHAFFNKIAALTP